MFLGFTVSGVAAVATVGSCDAATHCQASQYPSVGTVDALAALTCMHAARQGSFSQADQSVNPTSLHLETDWFRGAVTQSDLRTAQKLI